jgi:small subunit ribosomal protein S11
VAKEQKAAQDATQAPAKPAAGGAAAKRKKEFKKKREKRIVPHGVAHIAASFNNTQITITDSDGRTLCWSSAGAIASTFTRC